MPSIGLRWENSDYTDYYFGVRDFEATEARPAYQPSDALHWTAGLNIIYNHSDKIAFMIFPGVELLDDEITDSPLVDEDLLFRAMVGVTYAL